jgi:hypothetical protein
MMEIYGCWWRDEKWLRIGEYVLCLSHRPFSFSERTGRNRYLPMVGGWRLWLRRIP